MVRFEINADGGRPLPFQTRQVKVIPLSRELRLACAGERQAGRPPGGAGTRADQLPAVVPLEGMGSGKDVPGGGPSVNPEQH